MLSYDSGTYENTTGLSAKVSKDLLRAIDIVDKLKVPITLADPDLSDCPLMHSNPAFEDLTGFASPSSIGKNCRFLQGEKTNKASTAKIRRAIDKRRFCVSALTNYRIDESEFHNLLFISPITFKSGKCLLVGCQFQFDKGIGLESIKKGIFERDEMIETISDSFAVDAVRHQNVLTMRARTAVMQVNHYLQK